MGQRNCALFRVELRPSFNQAGQGPGPRDLGKKLPKHLASGGGSMKVECLLPGIGSLVA